MTDTPKTDVQTAGPDTSDLMELVTDRLARLLIAAGWLPPFDPADDPLSDHDFLELAIFAGTVENEGFSYAVAEYPPKFKDEALKAAISCAPLDRLKKLLDHHRAAVDEFWERDDAGDLLDAHLAAQRS